MPLSNRLQRSLVVGLFFFFGYHQSTIATGGPFFSRHDPSSVIDKNNPLWLEEDFYTGERRGPIAASSKQRKRPPPSTAILLRPPITTTTTPFLKGGSTQQQDASEEQESSVAPWSNILQFRRKRGKISIDLGEPKEDLERTTTVVGRMLGLSNATTTSNNNEATAALVPLLTPRLLEPGGNQNIEVSLSFDPSSAVRLVQTSVEVSAGGLGAFVATLRLLAPMIVARKLLTSIGYICYDYYNGRYLRTTYKKRIQDMHFYEIPSALRAAGRSGLQLVCMALTGKVFQLGLNRAPCWMPTSLCQYWYGMVWLGAVLAAGRAAEVWMTTSYPPLEIYPVDTCRGNSFSRVFTRPWHLLQWMSDPEEWLNNIARLSGGLNNNRNNNNRAFQPDALLFPSTWPPLHVLNGWAMIRAIRMTLSSSSKDASSSSSFVVMRSFIIHQAVHGEWYRVFFQEKRVALGVAVHAISFLALVTLIHATFSVDGVAGVLLTPALLASLVSGWMNILLYNERWLATAAAASTKPNNKRRQRQRSTTAKSLSPPQQGKNPFVKDDIEATTSWKNEMLQ